MTSRRRRGLTPEEAELWALVTREVTPLRRHRPAPIQPERSEALPLAAAEPAVQVRPPASQQPPAPIKRPPPLPTLASLDRKERRRLARGTGTIDARIDLHGLHQSEAHSALRGFIQLAHIRGHRLVLVITGKGRPTGAPAFEGERGVLRRLVPQWLGLPELRSMVVGFEEAQRGHGGAGALYVRLRRPRTGDDAR